RPLYPYYAEVPKLGGTALDDQAAAGVIMWVPGTLAFLLPLFVIGVRLLFGDDQRTGWQGDGVTGPTPPTGRIPLPVVASAPVPLPPASPVAFRPAPRTAAGPFPALAARPGDVAVNPGATGRGDDL